MNTTKQAPSSIDRYHPEEYASGGDGVSCVIADTGPVVAFLNRRDRWHQWAVDTFGRLQPPLLTCEAVIAEAMFLLRNSQGGVDAVLELIDRNMLQPVFRLALPAASGWIDGVQYGE